MPGNETYEDQYLYINNPRLKNVSRGRGRSSKSRYYNFPFYDASTRSEGGMYRGDYSLKEDEFTHSNARKRIKATHYENFVRKHPGGTKLCILCKLEDNQLNCQGILKWFSVKSKRGPGRPKDKGQVKVPRLISYFLSNALETALAPKVVTLKTEAGVHSEPIKIKIDMSKSGDCLLNGNGFSDPDIVDSCGFYIHVQCCRWTTNIIGDMEMPKAEKSILKGLGQICAHCNMHGATVCCRFETCKKKYHMICSLLAKCVPDISTSSMICCEHLGQTGGVEVQCSKCREDTCHSSMLHCMTCGSHTHQQCLSADVQMRPLVVAGWECDSCRSCQVCKKLTASFPSPAIDCIVCSKPHHMECVDPQEQPLQNPQWRCKICRNCADCGREVPLLQITSGSILPFVLCGECHSLRLKGVSCCICYKAMSSDGECVRCETCKSWLHPACESIDPEVLDMSNVYLCPVCRPGGKTPVVSRVAYNAIDNGHAMEDTFDENSQDSMSMTSENDETSLTPISSTHNSPGSSSLDSSSFYTVMPTKKGRLGVGLKLQRPPQHRKMPKILSGEGGSFQEKRDGMLPNEVVLYNESDQYTHTKDLCIMCGSIGAKEDGYLLNCQQCAKSYHSYCINKNVTATMLRIGWRCSDCLICEGCSKPGDPARLLLCEDCDVSFHTYCLTPALEQVPTGPWRCSWCVNCVKCQKTTPGIHSTWYHNYSVCGPCNSLISCLLCEQDYSEGEFVVKCSSCEHQTHGKCENIPSEDSMPKKFVCTHCDDLLKKEGKLPTKKLQSTTFSATKQALDSVIKHDTRITTFMDKNEKDFEAERDEREKNRIFGFDYIKALNKSRHEIQMQKNKKLSGADKDSKVNPMLEAGLTPPKDISSSQMYQQIIREITGGQQGSKASNKRGRGRCTNKNSDMLSPSKDSNAPRVRGRPRGSRNKAGAQRSRGKPMGQEMLQQQLSSDDNLSYANYPAIPQVPRPPPPPNMKSPMKSYPPSDDKEALLSTVQCLPQRYREIMMRTTCPDSQELKISRHPNEVVPSSDVTSSGGGAAATAAPVVPQPPTLLGYPAVSQPSPHLRLEPLSEKAPLKRSNSNKGRGKLVPQIMDPSQLIKPEISPAKMNSELALNFFGEELVPGGGDLSSPTSGAPQIKPPQQPMGPPMRLVPPALSSPVSHPVNTGLLGHPGKPPCSVQIKPKIKLPPSPLFEQPKNPSSVPPSPSNMTAGLTSPKPPTPHIKKEAPEPFDLSRVNVEDINICPESPVNPEHPDTLPEYNNRETVINKPVGGQEVEEEERDEAVSFYFAGLFGDDDLDMEESAKGSPIYNPPDANAEKVTLKNLEEMDEAGGELPSELNAILESIEAKPMGTEIDDNDPWSEKPKARSNEELPSSQLVSGLELGDEFLGLELEGFDFPGFFDDMKKLETEHRKADRSDFDKILDPPVAVNKRPSTVNTFKTWEEEEKKGHLGTVPQLLYANSTPEMNILKVHCPDTLERFKIVNKAFSKLSKEEKKIYFTNSKKNKLRKAEAEYPVHMDQPPPTPTGGWPQQPQFEGNRMPPQEPDKLSADDQETLRQSQRERRQRLYERHPTRQIKEGTMAGSEQMMGSWPRFRGPEEGSSSTVTVGPIPPKGGMPPNQIPPVREAAITPMPQGPMTPTAPPIRSPMATPRGISPMNVQMIPPNAMMGGPGYIQRHFDPGTGQWVHTNTNPGAHTPLRHLPPQGIMAQQNMVQFNHMEQFALQQQQQQQQQAPEPPQPPPKATKKRTKKKKEKPPPTPAPMDPQVNLESLPPHLRFGGPQNNAAGPEFQGTAPGHPAGFDYNEQFRQAMHMPGMPNQLTKSFKQGNSPMLKSPQGLELDRPKSLNINNNSPSGTPKSMPNTPNKSGVSKNSSPLTKTDDFPVDLADSQQQMQQKQAIRIALEQRKQQQSHYMSQQMVMPSNFHLPMNVSQFVQFRMQQDWLKKFKTLKATGGGIPPVPPHPNNLSSQQIQAMYNRLMEHIMISMANSRMAMGPAGHQAMMDQMSPVVEEEKKPKATKKRKKKKAETPVKKDDKAKMPKMGPNLVMQTAMGPGPLAGNSPQPDNFVAPHNIASNSVGFQQGMGTPMPQNMTGQGGGPPHLGIINPNHKHLNMRNPGPALMVGPHVSHIPGQTHHQQRLMAPQFAPAVPGNSDPRFIRPTLTTQSPHFHDNYDIEPPRTPKPSSRSKSKTKSKETFQLSVPKSVEPPMQADSPRYQLDTPRYQHQIKIEDNQDFSDVKSPQSQRSQTPSSASTPTTKDPFDNLPLTPSICSSLESAAAASKRRKRRTKAEMDEIKAERERTGYVPPPPRSTNKNIPAVVQPDIGKMVDIVVRGTDTTLHCKLHGSYGRAVIQDQPNYYRDMVSRIKQAQQQKEAAAVKASAAAKASAAVKASTPAPSPVPSPQINEKDVRLHKQQSLHEQHMEKLRAHIHHPPTVLTPQQEKILCQKFGVTPAEAQRMYYYQQHQHMLALREQQIKAYQMQEQLEHAKSSNSEVEKSKILEQIRSLQESREKNCPGNQSPSPITLDKIKQEENVSVSVKQQSDSIQLIFQRPIVEKSEKKEALVEPVIKHHKPKLELTKPTPPIHIKQEYGKDGIQDNMLRELPFAISGPDFTPAIKPCNPPTDEKTTRVINLHKAFQMLSDMLGMKLKKDNLASLNELRVQNIIPGSLPHNLVCYNCVVTLHPNKLKHIAPGRPYYGIKDEHGATFCSDSCLAQYYCKKFSSLRPEDGPPQMMNSPGHKTPENNDHVTNRHDQITPKSENIKGAETDIRPDQPKTKLDIVSCGPDHLMSKDFIKSDPLLWTPPPLKQHLPSPPPPSSPDKPFTSPGKRRRESESWKYWSVDDMSIDSFVNNFQDTKPLFEQFRKWHEEHDIKNDVVDQRVCMLCGGVGDGLPNGPSRLLNYRKSCWIHLNCALWSNDVHETRDGSLANVQQICKRAQDSTCSYCNRIGASIACFKPKCTAWYHFLCGRHAQCAFYTNKTVYCAAHKCPGMICSDFAVRRRVVIDKDIQQLLTNEGFKEPGDKMRVGPLIFHHPGHILNNTSNFHSRNIIYPFDYSASRMFWSTEVPGARCMYHCSIDVMNEVPLFRISYKKEDDQTVGFENPCLDALWKDILESIAQVRSKTPDSLSLHVSFHPGSFLHGITERSMLRIIEGLPGSDKLEGYTFCYGRIETVTLEHLVPFNPSQSARTEKYTKHTKRISLRVGTHRQVSSSVQGSQTPNLWNRDLDVFHDMLPYQKSFNRASQYRRLKTEWKLNVLLRRSGIQGLGLYARRFIDRNTMVIEYVGQLIRTSLCDKRETYYNSKNIGCYMFKIDDVVAVDATLTGGPARYINHSCEPNCVAEIVTFEREKKIIIISKRKIQQGEELTYDYKFDFEDDSEKIPCNCGSVVCRKWMN